MKIHYLAAGRKILNNTPPKQHPSYRRAAELFTAATGGATLHQLRHSALTHAAEDGANTSTLLSFSGQIGLARNVPRNRTVVS